MAEDSRGGSSASASASASMSAAHSLGVVGGSLGGVGGSAKPVVGGGSADVGLVGRTMVVQDQQRQQQMVPTNTTAAASSSAAATTAAAAGASPWFPGIPPPTPLPAYAPLPASVDARCDNLIARLAPDTRSLAHRESITSYMRTLMKTALEKEGAAVEVFEFGSVPLRTYLPDGDIDLCLFSFGTPLPEAWIEVLREELERVIAKGGSTSGSGSKPPFVITEVTLIHAEVRLLKCVVQPGNIVVDVSANQYGGQCAVAFLESMDRKFANNHLYKRAVLLVKAWCYYEAHVLGAHHGLLSTYAVDVLVLYLFNIFHDTITSPLAALRLFLGQFAAFPWEHYGLSLMGPIPMPGVHAHSSGGAGMPTPPGTLQSAPAQPPAAMQRDDNAQGGGAGGGDTSGAAANASVQQQQQQQQQQQVMPPPPPPGVLAPGAENSLRLREAFLRELYEKLHPAAYPQTRPFAAKFLNIIDPLLPNNNLGRSVSQSNFFRIRSALALGYEMLSDVIAAHDAGGDWESLWEVFFQNLHESSSLGQDNNPSRGKNDGGSAKAVPSAETASAAPAPVAEADTNGTAISPPSPSSESDDASNPLAGDLSKLMHQLAIARTCVQQQYLWNTKGMGFGMPPGAVYLRGSGGMGMAPHGHGAGQHASHGFAPPGVGAQQPVHRGHYYNQGGQGMGSHPQANTGGRGGTSNAQQSRRTQQSNREGGRNRRSNMRNNTADNAMGMSGGGGGSAPGMRVVYLPLATQQQPTVATDSSAGVSPGSGMSSAASTPGSATAAAAARHVAVSGKAVDADARGSGVANSTTASTATSLSASTIGAMVVPGSTPSSGAAVVSRQQDANKKSNTKKLGGFGGQNFARLVSLALEKKLEKPAPASASTPSMDPVVGGANSHNNNNNNNNNNATTASSAPGVGAKNAHPMETAPNYTLSDSDFPPLGGPPTNRR